MTFSFIFYFIFIFVIWTLEIERDRERGRDPVNNQTISTFFIFYFFFEKIIGLLHDFNHPHYPFFNLLISLLLIKEICDVFGFTSVE